MTEPAPSCYRCGYDQTGAIATWSASECPLGGLCTECGLEFLWRDVLNPAYIRKGRFFEHTRVRLFAAFVVTLARSLRGLWLWRWIGMQHAVSWKRIALFLPLAWIIFAAAASLILVKGETVLTWLRAELWPSGRWPPDWSDSYAFESLTVWTHYSMLGPRVFSVERLLEPWIIVSILTALVMPATFLLLPITLRRARVKRSHLFRILAYHSVTLPFVATFLVVVGTAAGVVSLLDMHYEGARFHLLGLGKFLSRHQVAVGIACAAVWVFAWWSAATRHYLRLDQPRLVALAMTAMAVGIAVGLIALVPGGLTWLVW